MKKSMPTSGKEPGTMPSGSMIGANRIASYDRTDKETASLEWGLEITDMPSGDMASGDMASTSAPQGGNMPEGGMKNETGPDNGLTVRAMPSVEMNTMGGGIAAKARTVSQADLEALTRSKSFVPLTAGLAIGARGKDVERLQSYLREFGYIGTEKLLAFGATVQAGDVAAPTTGEFDGETERALKAFQQFNSLPVTGQLDQATLDLMSRPRCGFPDTMADFSAQGSRWNKNNLTYAFNEFTPDLTQAEIRTAVQQAFSQWAAVTPLSFTEVAIGGNPDIVIRFVSGNHGDGSNFDGASGVLAHAYYPPPWRRSARRRHAL